MEQPRYLTANPPGVRTYRDTHAFIAEDPQRQSSWDAPGDIRGWDVSDGFLLAEPRAGRFGSRSEHPEHTRTDHRGQADHHRR